MRRRRTEDLEAWPGLFRASFKRLVLEVCMFRYRMRGRKTEKQMNRGIANHDTLY